MKKFVNESQVKSLLVYRTVLNRDDVDGDAESTPPEINYGVQLAIEFLSHKETSVAFIKRGLVIEGDKMAEQAA